MPPKKMRRTSEPDNDGEDDWRNAKGHSERFAYLLESGLWSDVEFFVGKTKEHFQAHKFILRTGSKVFDTIFNEDHNINTYEIPELEPHEFGLLLKFLYNGKLPRNAEEAFPLLRCSLKYDITNLSRVCARLLTDQLNQGNSNKCLQIYQQARTYGASDLEGKALKCICSVGYDVVKSEQFLELNTDELSNILARDDFQIQSEYALFDAVVKWGMRKRQKTPKNMTSMKTVLQNLMPFIRFPLMDPTEFALKVIPLDVLCPEEAIPLLVYFSVNKAYRNGVSTGIFNCIPRMPYVPRGRTYILLRLKKPSGSMADLSAYSNNAYIIPTTLEQSIRFKSNKSIWVTSIGMNTTNEFMASSNSEQVAAKIQLKDDDDKILAIKIEELTNVKARVHAVHHIKFSSPVHIVKDQWFSASFTMKSGQFYADNYTVATGDGTSLNFELRERRELLSKDNDNNHSQIQFCFRESVNPIYTGLTQGFIPEIGFMID